MKHNTPPRLALYLLGAPRVELEGKPVSLSHHKAWALLAYLAVTRRPHPRQALATLLWPDYDPATARGELRRMLWVLNKSLGRDRLEIERETVLLPAQPDQWLDIEQFRELLAAGRRTSPSPGQLCSSCLEPLMEAVDLARGDFLAGFSLADSPEFDTWQTFETESLRRELAGALEQLVQLLSQSGQAASEQTIAYARRWLALDPLHEPAQRQLMALYFWAGQATTALLQYQSCARLLETELGISPSAETTALAEAIKLNRLPPPVELATDNEPEPVKISPLPSVPATPPHNLPLQATPFVGREAALDSLQQRLADPEVRLMTIIGPGGIGKTRLALALAERELRAPAGAEPASPSFADGIYFVSLAPTSSVETLVQTIAAGLAFPLASAQEPTVQLLAYLRHKQMLLVLDSFENVLAGAALVSQILQAAAGVKMLVTSRERLNLAHENLWPISGLDFARLTSVDKALGYDAVRLFVQRARQVRPDFTLQAEGLPHLERILHGVWGMPLAIELAAAWLNMLSLAEIAAELSHGLDLLEGEVRDVPNRHRSMRLVFDRSWERLEPEERALFKALSVFRGHFSRDAAQQVTGASLRLLAGLVNKSLLASQPDSGRYELHDLIRQYAAEHLRAEPDTERTIRDRHSDYYLSLLQSHEPALRSHRQKEALAALNADLENIRTAWETAAAHKEIERLHRAAFPLWYFYNLRDSLREGEIAFQRAADLGRDRLAALAPDQPGPARAQLEAALGEFLSHQAQYTFRQGRIAEAADLYQTSLALLRPLDEPAALGQALTYCGVVCWIAGEFDQAWPYLNEGLACFSQLGDKWLQAQTRTFMGMVAHAQGDYPGAYAYLSDSMAAARGLGDPRLMSLVVGQLSRAAQALGRMDEVLDLLREALQLTTATGDRLGIGVTLEQMAIAMQANGDAAEGCWLLQESINQFRDVGDSWFLSHALNLAGYFALAADDEPQAFDSFKEAGHIAMAAQATPNLLDTLAGLAMLSARQGQPERALALAQHILQNPASSQEAKDRAESLRAQLETQLTPRQLEVIPPPAPTQNLEHIFKAVLESMGSSS